MGEYTADTINTLSMDEMLNMRLFSKFKIADIYVIIGYLQEYFGGYDLDEKCVDGFFVNELEKARVFEKICRKYLHENGLNDDVELFISETGHSAVISRTICSCLSKYYTEEKKEFLNHRGFLLSPKDDLFKSPEELAENNLWNLNQLSFLIGFYIRNLVFKEKEEFLNVANAGHKMSMAIDFFKNFCNSGDSIKVEYHFNVPCVSNIYFTKGPFFRGFEKEIKNYLKSL